MRFLAVLKHEFLNLQHGNQLYSRLHDFRASSSEILFLRESRLTWRIQERNHVYKWETHVAKMLCVRVWGNDLMLYGGFSVHACSVYADS